MNENTKDDRKPVPFEKVVERLLGTPPAPQEKGRVQSVRKKRSKKRGK